MNLQELNAFAVARKVDELNLISMEGGIYLLEARMHGAAYPLSDPQGKMLTLRSVEHARDVLHTFRCCRSIWCTPRCTMKCAVLAPVAKKA